MIEIKFSGDDIGKLKNEVREFAICHLGINFESLSQTVAAPRANDHADEGKGIPLIVPPVMNGADTAETPRKKPGRQPGWRKNAEPAQVETAGDTNDFVTETAAAPPPATVTAPPVLPTLEEVRTAVNSLITSNKIDVAREFLARFKATKVSEVKEQDRWPLICLIKETLKK